MGSRKIATLIAYLIGLGVCLSVLNSCSKTDAPTVVNNNFIKDSDRVIYPSKIIPIYEVKGRRYPTFVYEIK